MAKLVQISGADEGAEYHLGELCIIGRSPNAHVRLMDRTVSRHHAKLTRLDGVYVLEDLESGRGTLVNGLNVTASKLRSGDTVTIVGATFRFEDTAINPAVTAEFSLALEEGLVQAEGASPDAASISLPRLTPDRGARDRLETLLSIGHLVSTDAGETDAVLRRLAERCLRLFPDADRALVAVPNHQTRRLEVRALVLRDGVHEHRFHLSRAITSQVLSRGRPTASVESQRLGSGDGAPTSEVALVVAPILAQGKKLGLVYVDRLGSRAPFTDEDLALLVFVAGQAGMVLQSAQLRRQLAVQSRAEQELSAAREVQKRFLPRGVPKVPGFSFVAHYDPCRDVGGDLYDFITLDARRVGVVIGDVAGKGLAAALVMAWIVSQLRVAAHRELRPSDVLQRINDGLLEARQDEMFVTLFYGVLDRLSLNLDFCNAGHMPPLLRRAGGDLETISEASSLPVGLVSDAVFDESRICLARGDSVLLFSDGVTEAQNARGEMFGTERLERAIRRGSDRASDMVSSLLQDMRAFAGDTPPSDDVTIVAVGAGSDMEDIRTTLPPGTRWPSV